MLSENLEQKNEIVPPIPLKTIIQGSFHGLSKKYKTNDMICDTEERNNDIYMSMV